MRKQHGSIARKGKVRNQGPKVANQERAKNLVIERTNKQF